MAANRKRRRVWTKSSPRSRISKSPRTAAAAESSGPMIEKIIEYSIRNRFIVIMATLVVVAWGVYAVINTPVDAIPDLSENQVIVFTDWMGRSPQEIEEQVTYPLSVNL